MFLLAVGFISAETLRGKDSLVQYKQVFFQIDKTAKAFQEKGESQGKVGDSSQLAIPASPYWEQICFNPVYLHRLPKLVSQKIGTEVTIGTYAKKPLKLKIPVIIGGMGYQTALRAEAKQALALGATLIGTAANTGNGPLLLLERSAAEKLVVQFSRGCWDKDLSALSVADAVEIHLGYGLSGSMTMRISGQRLARNERLRRMLGGELGKPEIIAARLLSIRGQADLENLIAGLREKSGGVPVGVKIGAAQWLERELELITGAQPDYIAIYGMEAGQGNPVAPRSRMGIPVLFGIERSARFLRERGLSGRISLLAGGGLRTPAEFLKALALGADAVFIGNAALDALAAGMSRKRLIRFSLGWNGQRIDIPSAAEGLRDYLQSTIKEMQEIALCLGRAHLREVGKEDLSTTSKELASCLSISWCGKPDAFERRPLSSSLTKQTER
jgi:glutamate synthase domain-containing protein 2